MADVVPVVVAPVVAAPPGPQLTDAESMLSQSDDAFALEFGLTPPGSVKVPGDQVAAQVADDAGEGETAEDGVLEDQAAEETDEATDDAVEVEEADVEADQGGKPKDAAEVAGKPDPSSVAPITAFTVLGPDGKPAVLPEHVKFSFKANGKQQTDIPLDKLVRLAQSGFYNEKLVAEVDTARARVPQLENDAAALSQQLQAQRALNIRLLEDEDFLEESRGMLTQSRGPEGRAQRAEAQLRQVNENQAATALRAEAQNFADTKVLPTMTALVKAYPAVSADELYGKFSLAINPYLRNGVIPKDQWARAVDMLEGDLGQWMAQLQESRTTSKAVETKAESAKVLKAQETATKAKNQLARATKPSAGQATRVAAKPKPIVDVDDAMADILGSVQWPKD